MALIEIRLHTLEAAELVAQCPTRFIFTHDKAYLSRLLKAEGVHIHVHIHIHMHILKLTYLVF
jgi:hypothetical protein